MSSILALDIGESRIGIALANDIARLASPFMTIQNVPSVYDELKAIIEKEAIETVVVGLPRNLSGEDTAQTKYCRDFADKLSGYSKIVFQDEALTSTKAEAELRSRGKPYTKGDIDALAATYILEDYLNNTRKDS